MAEITYRARDLITSQAWLPAETLVRDLVDWFKADSTREYAAVVDSSSIKGLVSREGLNARLAASEVGFSVYSNRPITRVMLPGMVVVSADDTIPEIVQRLQKERPGLSEFYDDIVVHDKGSFLGLASVKQLVIRQMQQIQQQMDSLERQQAALLQKNRELLEANITASTASQQFRSFFETSSIPIVVFNLSGQFLEANPRFRKLAGYEPSSLTDQVNATVLFQGGFEPAVRATLDSISAGNTDNRNTYYMALRRANGSQAGVEVSLDVNRTEQKILCSVIRVLDQDEAAARDRVLSEVTSSADLRGKLGELSILDLAQLLVQSRKTGQLNVTTEDGRNHHLYFETGRIVHAASPDQEGKPVLRHFVMLRHGDFMFANDLKAPKRTLEGDSISLLLDACAEGDEDLAGLN